METYEYSVFGKCLHSPIPLKLPQLTGGEEGQFALLLGSFEKSKELDQRLGDIRHGKTKKGYQIDIPWLGSFLLTEAGDIYAESIVKQKPRVLETYLIGLILSLWLDRSEAVVLHGSAVQVPDGAVLFIGNQGAGKSTTAATFSRNGNYPILCDDAIPIGPGPLVWPGIPFPKLLPDAMERLYGAPQEFPQLFDGIDKYQVDFGQHGHRCRPILLVILEIQDGPELSITPLKGFQKAQGISNHLQLWGQGDQKASKFQKILDYCGSLSTFLVKRPKDRSSMDEIMDFLVSRTQ